MTGHPPAEDDFARLTGLAIRRAADGVPGYMIENAFGQSIQVLPRPPGYRATITLEWQGAMPEEIQALLDRARIIGLRVDLPD